jgi:hypothetical protein
MAKKKPALDLGQQIEQVVQAYIQTIPEIVADSVNQAIQKSNSSKKRRLETPERRTPQEIAALAEALYQCILSNPGQTMSNLAPMLGLEPRYLTHPVKKLREWERIRTVGKRNDMQYFPRV